MIIIIAAGICSVLSLVYFIRLMADAKKLQERLQKLLTELSQEAQVGKERLIALDYSMWTAPHFCKAEGASGGCAVKFY